MADNFTRCEKEVIEFLVQGLSNKDIAAKRFVTVFVIKFHLTKIYKKLGVKSRGEAIAKLAQMKTS